MQTDSDWNCKCCIFIIINYRDNGHTNKVGDTVWCNQIRTVIAGMSSLISFPWHSVTKKHYRPNIWVENVFGFLFEDLFFKISWRKWMSKVKRHSMRVFFAIMHFLRFFLKIFMKKYKHICFLYILYKMLSLTLDVMLTLSKTTSPKKLFRSDCTTL